MGCSSLLRPRFTACPSIHLFSLVRDFDSTSPFVVGCRRPRRNSSVSSSMLPDEADVKLDVVFPPSGGLKWFLAESLHHGMKSDRCGRNRFCGGFCLMEIRRCPLDSHVQQTSVNPSLPEIINFFQRFITKWSSKRYGSLTKPTSLENFMKLSRNRQLHLGI